MTFREAAAAVDKITGRMAPTDEVKPVYYSQVLRRSAKSIPRSKYLEGRSLEMAPGLQFSDSVDYRTGEEDGDPPLKLPAMLAPVTRNGEFMTYHVTYLQNGSKANVPTPRKILPGPEWGGGAVELFPRNGTCLGIAEGVETAIAAHMLHRTIPVWAALNTSGMKNWKPPEGVEDVVIFADNDLNYAGHAAAYALAHKLHSKVKSVQVWMPVTAGTDWNDFLISQRKAGVIT
jgi:putative DNA primase/helicase